MADSNQKKVAIIGAGMAGLSAGTYLTRNGFDTHIFEMHDVPGGLCTSWFREGYTVDFCIHWLVGSSPGDVFYYEWNELMDMPSVHFINHKVHARFFDGEGNKLNWYTNLDALRKELLRISPEDEQHIEEYCRTCERLTHLKLKMSFDMAHATLGEKLQFILNLLPYGGIWYRYSRMTCEDFAGRFKSKLIKNAMEHFFDKKMPIFFIMMTQVWLHKNAAGYPLGGSMRFINHIAKTFKEEGGELHLKRSVKRILHENGQVKGLELETGEKIDADYVISAADLNWTMKKALEDQFKVKAYEEAFNSMETFPSLIFLSLGIKKEFPGFSGGNIGTAKNPIQLDPETKVDSFLFRSHAFDPHLAPQGKTVITSMIPTRNHNYWEELRAKDPEGYEAKKLEILNWFIDELEAYTGPVREYIEFMDCATPATIKRYTGNWKGSYEGWLITPNTGFKQLPNEVRELENLYLCGQWLAIGGGLPPSMVSGKKIAHAICDKEGLDFTTERVDKR